MATINDVDFSNARLDRAEFDLSSIDVVNFEGASLIGTSFNIMAIENAKFFDTDLSAIIGLDSEELTSNFGDASTKLPLGVDPPENWPKQKLERIDRVRWMRKEREKKKREKDKKAGS